MTDPLAEALLRRGDALVLVVGADGVVRDASNALSAALGLPVDALRGRRLEALLDAAFPITPGVLEDLLHVANASAELPFARPDRPPSWLTLRATPVTLEEGPAVVLMARDDTQHRAVRRSDVQLSALAQKIPGVLWTTDLDLKATSIIGGGLPLRNRSRSELLGAHIGTYFGNDPQSPPMIAHRQALSGKSGHYEFERAGHRFHARVDPLRGHDGAVQGTLGLALEVTEPRRIESRLRAVQREQTLGRLAGSMAHEFNNLLTVIATHAVLLEDQLGGAAGNEDLVAVQEAAKSGRLLTSRLLAFTSRQIQQPERVRVDRLLRELEPMLRTIVGERRRLELHTDPAAGWVRIDPALLEQVVLNLVDNARQATEEGGRIVVRSSASPNLLAPGVELTIEDDGVGMSETVRSRAAEPFYTTRASGQGSGLGLSTALAVVTEADGRLTIDSAPGEGTRVSIGLPRAKAPTGAFPVQAPAGRVDETILLVEDQLGVRRAARRILRRAGYQVFEAAHADDALAVVTAFPGAIDVLVTDVVMPGLSGPQLAEQLVALRPELRVLYMSGYAEDVEEVRAAIERGQTFLAKPFTPEQLLRRVREALGEGLDDGDGGSTVEDGGDAREA